MEPSCHKLTSFLDIHPTPSQLKSFSEVESIEEVTLEY